MTPDPASSAGEELFSPSLYQCSVADPDHSVSVPCGICRPIRSPEKTALMRTLTTTQYALLGYMRDHPGSPITPPIISLIELDTPTSTGRLTEVRVGVAAGQLQQRGLLRYKLSLSRIPQLTWWVTEQGQNYLD